MGRLGVDHVRDPHHGGAGERGFVDVAENHRVAMGIENPGCDMQAGAVDHVGVCRKLGLEFADHLNLASVDQQVCLGQDPFGSTGPKGGVAHENPGRREGRSASHKGIGRHTRGGDDVRAFRSGAS